MSILQLQLRPTESETWGMGPSQLYGNKPSGWFWYSSSLRTSVLMELVVTVRVKVPHHFSAHTKLMIGGLWEFGPPTCIWCNVMVLNPLLGFLIGTHCTSPSRAHYIQTVVGHCSSPLQIGDLRTFDKYVIHVFLVAPTASTQSWAGGQSSLAEPPPPAWCESMNIPCIWLFNLWNFQTIISVQVSILSWRMRWETCFALKHKI